ncbi:MAG: toxin-antitoxin system YwqK family antitoxin [Acidimicrobiales bacterium]
MRRFYPGGTHGQSEEHWQDGHLHDPPDGSPALCGFRPDKTVEHECHCQDGHLQDLPDGSPAVRRFRSNGSVESEEHWQDGRRIS